MNLNLDGSSPWFHVHFTLPNQTNKRSEVKYESERKRIKELIQSKDAFLAPSSHRNTNQSGPTKPAVKITSKVEFKTKLARDKVGNFALRKPWFNQNGLKQAAVTQSKNDSTEKKIFIDTKASNTTTLQDRKSIFPPLEGSKTGVISCRPWQHDNIAVTKEDQDEVEAKDQGNSTLETAKPENQLSIADCYDLCNWKPQNSLCKEARPLVSILKRNTRFNKETPRHIGQSSIPQRSIPQSPKDSSESSGNETESNETNKLNKKVRFAKGTKFSPNSTNRKYRTRRNNLDSKFEAEKELSGDENNFEDLIELSFREFIERKRVERSKVMAEISKDSSVLCFLKEENRLPKLTAQRKQQKPPRNRSKSNKTDQEGCRSKDDTFLPTVVN